MHYWILARQSERPIPDVNAHFLIKNVQKKQYLNSLKDLRSVVNKLKIYDINVGRDQAFMK